MFDGWNIVDSAATQKRRLTINDIGVCGAAAVTSCITEHRLTEHDLGGRFWWKPEDDEGQEAEKYARQHQDVLVEDGDSLDFNPKRDVRIRSAQSGVVDDVPFRWTAD